MILESELRALKEWRLRKLATDKRKALGYATDPRHRVANREWMVESIMRDLEKINSELAARKATA